MALPIRTEPFLLVIIDHDRGVFSIEGPMNFEIEGKWRVALAEAWKAGRRLEDFFHENILDRDLLAAAVANGRKLREMPSGTIIAAPSRNLSRIDMDLKQSARPVARWWQWGRSPT